MKKKLAIQLETLILGMAYSVVPFSGIMILELILNASQEAGVVDWVNAIWMFASVSVLLYFSWMLWKYLNKKLQCLREEMKSLKVNQ